MGIRERATVAKKLEEIAAPLCWYAFVADECGNSGPHERELTSRPNATISPSCAVVVARWQRLQSVSTSHP
jgi:hypothetical protein